MWSRVVDLVQGKPKAVEASSPIRLLDNYRRVMRSVPNVGQEHLLRHFFKDMVRRRFDVDVRLPGSRLATYVAGLLVDFTHDYHGLQRALEG